jgi:hypothetical protein
MSSTGVFGVIALIVIVAGLVAWILLILRANHDPVQAKGSQGRPKRGPVSGGVIRAEPGQSILTGEAPREDEPPKKSPLDL